MIRWGISQISKINRPCRVAYQLAARCYSIPSATQISRRYEVVYKSYSVNLQKASIIVALSSILLVMILDTLLTHKPLDGYRIYLLYPSIMLLFISSTLGVISIVRDCINYSDADKILAQIDGMYYPFNADDTFLNEVMRLNKNVNFCVNVMSALTVIAIFLLLLAVIGPVAFLAILIPMIWPCAAPPADS